MIAVAVALLAFGAAPELRALDPPLARVREVLPKDWRVETAGLPPGVAAIALGPEDGSGRPVLIASRLAFPDAALDRAAIEERIGAKITAFEPRGMFGATEITAEVSEGGTTFVVLHLIGPSIRPYAVSLIAPKSSFARAYKTLAIAAERLASQKGLSEKVVSKPMSKSAN
jgi:hypothetical protein